MTTRPQISVIIPCHNNATELEHCLAALSAFSFEDTEYIVVDDGSTDESCTVARRATIPVRLVRLPLKTGAAAARNIGVRHASGDLLVFLDADVCIHRDTLPLIASAFSSDEGLGALMGSYDDTPSVRTSYSQYRNLLHCYVHRTGRREACTFWTGCGAIRRNVFRRYGGFDERPGGIDDVELGGRLARAGVRVELRHDIQVQHRKRWTFLSSTKTDICSRGIPWTVLVLRDRRIPNTLNLDYRNRISVGLVWLAFLFMANAYISPKYGLFVPVLLGAAIWVNRRLYRFFRERGGKTFAATSAAAHLLHLFYCGLSFLLGAAGYAFSALIGRWTSQPSGRTELQLEQIDAHSGD